MAKIDLNNYEAFLLDYFEGNLSEELALELKAFVIANPSLDIDLEDSDFPVFTKDETVFESKSGLFKTADNIPLDELLEYLEGNLDTVSKLEFENKITGDADLARELHELKKTLLIADDSERFGLKKKLIKTEEQFVLNNRALLYFEDQLDVLERADFEKELRSNPELQKEFALVERTKLAADVSIVYPNKEALKKEGRVIALFTVRMAVAAALLIIVGASVLFTFYNTGNPSTEKTLAKTVNTNTIPLNKTNKANEIEAQGNSTLVAEKNSSSKASKNKNSNHVNSVIAFTSNPVVTNQSTVEPIPNVHKEEKEESLVNNNALKNSTDTNSVNGGPVIRYTNISALAVVKDTEDEIELSDKPARKGFWKRAVRLAQQVNGLGLKAVKGDEKENENYSLSFNSFSIEKK